MAITWPAKNNYATGDVLTATNMNGIGDDLNALFDNSFYAGKNKIINGDFGIWQRGTSFTTAGATGQYTADRWYVIGDPANSTISQQTFTPGSAPVSGYEGQYYLRFVKGGTTANQMFLIQRVEDVRQFAGQTVTISYWAKASSAVTNEPLVQQSFGTGGSTDVYTTTATQSLTTSWARYSVSVAVPSISGKTIGTNSFVAFWPLRYTGTSNITAEIWGVQVEAGSTATPFQTATGTKQGELAACQRYLPAFSGSSLGGNLANVLGWAYSTTNAQFNIMLPVTPRVRPTGLTYSALSDFTIANQSFSGAAPTAITFNSGGQQVQINVTTTAGSPTLVLGQPVNLALSGANGLLLFTGCEL